MTYNNGSHNAMEMELSIMSKAKARERDNDKFMQIMISLCFYYAHTTMEGRVIDKLIS
jgi:hypothetical protein